MKSIESLKLIFKEEPIRFIKVSDEIPDWKQLLIMSNCDHNIIANSTFSWWGAYFNLKTDKIICYPSIWFGNNLQQHNINDMCPTFWTRIDI